MYRDDLCAVCGESLPPDHFYCREHAVDVDGRLHDIAGRLPDLRARTGELHDLVDGIAEETWDYVAESDPADPVWPPTATVDLRVDSAQIDVDVDSEPGYVRVRLQLSMTELLAAARDGLATVDDERFVRACASAHGAGVTH